MDRIRQATANLGSNLISMSDMASNMGNSSYDIMGNDIPI
jgi:hypothetical protein